MVARNAYMFFGTDADNMVARLYLVYADGSVQRWCTPRGCATVIRQSVARDQAAAEMRQLRSVCEYNTWKGAN